MRLIKGLAITLAILVLIVVIAPVGGKWYMQHWLSQKGVSAVVGQFGVNIFVGKVTIGGASLTKSGQEHAGVFLALGFCGLNPGSVGWWLGGISQNQYP